MWTIIWAVIAAISLIIEVSTVALLSIWFTVGAVVALIMSLFNLPVFLQILSFIVVSGSLFTLAWKYIISKKPEKTNSPLFIGKRAVVTETIDYSKNTGKVKVNDQYWSAIPKDKGKIIEKNSVVVITEVCNTKFVVDEAENIAEENKEKEEIKIEIETETISN